MNLTFEIGVRTKWLLIGIAIVLLGLLGGYASGWSDSSAITVLSIILMVIGGLMSVISLISIMVHDFEYNG